ncbi:MAG: amidophosphoribosyltransferase [Ruminococcus sp.]|nr:amidophosphoribosyltransferase [Ruminococcus sp.]
MYNNLPDKPHDECGVFGFYNNDNFDLAALTRDALYGLQHRGQESVGLTIIKDGEPYSVKDLGIVSNVLTDAALSKLPEGGKISVGHVRYTTLDYLERAATQPLVMRYIEGSLAIAHNGSLTNFAEIRTGLEKGGAIFQSNSHAEVIGYTIATNRVGKENFEQAVQKTMDDLKGAYSAVISSPEKLYGVRDPHGFKPLCLGKLKNSYIIASESCVIDTLGGEFIRDIDPGEVVMIGEDGISSFHCATDKFTSLCLFEYVYLARPDSVIDGVNVNEARHRAGRLLFEENPVDADIVCGVPDSGLDAAQGFAEASGITYATTFIKNKYIGRTSKGVGNEKKEKLLRMRLNVLKNVVDGKRVVIIDDSIIHGNTSAHIVKLLKEAGAKEVHMRISSPEFVYPCFFGVDLPDEKDLISNKLSVEELREKIGADSLSFLSIEGLHKIAEGCKIKLCDGCFSGIYYADLPKIIFEDRFANKIKK